MTKTILIISLIFLDISTINASTFFKKNENGNFDADLRNVDLAEITKFIGTSYGIEFKGEDSLFHGQINVAFKNLTLEKALKRVLSRVSSVITYNNYGEVIAVTLLQRGKNIISATNSRQDYENDKFKTISSPEFSEIPPELTKTTQFIARSVNSELTKTEKEEIKIEAKGAVTNFQAVLNAGPPGEKGGMRNAAESNDFQVVRNARPPGE